LGPVKIDTVCGAVSLKQNSRRAVAGSPCPYNVHLHGALLKVRAKFVTFQRELALRCNRFPDTCCFSAIRLAVNTAHGAIVRANILLL
jgi:hypothetical protein